MKVALAQMDVISGRPKKNLETMLRMIDEAKENGADLIVFPEMCVSGYLLSDTWLREDAVNYFTDFNEMIRQASQGIAIAYGNVFVESSSGGFHPNKDGRSRKYNAIYVVQDGEYAARMHSTMLPDGVQPKTLHPNYRIFDDERYFFSLQDVSKDMGVPLEALLSPFIIRMKDGDYIPVGFELCEDLWIEDYRMDGEPINPTKILIGNGAELIINLSASPWTYMKNSARDRRVQFLRKESGEDFVPFLYLNCVGAQNNGKNIVVFDGGSTVYDSDANPILHSSQPFLEQMLYVDTEKIDRLPVEQRVEKPKIAQKYEAIIRGIRHFKDILGKEEDPSFLVGLSGGIDSSVGAALLALAVGSEKVSCYNLPTKFNSDRTISAARYVAEKLQVDYREIPIQGIVDANEHALFAYGLEDQGISPLTKQNIQAKIRGASILSNIAGEEGKFWVNTGNKLEVALGYATLYGDVGGAFSILGDLTKAEVFEMARYLNEEIFREEVIPYSLVPDSLFRFSKDKIAPSAELEDMQVDPMKFGYHDALLEAFTDYAKKTPEDILSWYLEGTLAKNLGISESLISRWGIDDPKVFVKDLEWFTGLYQRSVFKRVQSPPIVITSKSSFGYDIRESMLPLEPTFRYESLKAEVLGMKIYVSGGGLR
ncbi:MAG: NAD(+) synthase [Candidatus Woesearchaeota archaeon]|nr:NAD(+) synthase [Candidatus Woesearchaeota archaeon]